MKSQYCTIFLFVMMLLQRQANSQDSALELFPADPCFKQGVQISGPKHGDSSVLVDVFGNHAPDAKPLWNVAQWHSKGMLDRCENQDNTTCLYDDFKSLTIDRSNGSFNMTVLGEKEYEKNVRTNPSDPWAHLLLCQAEQLKTPMLHTLDQLLLELEFEMTQFHSALKSPAVFHAAQFQLFLYLRGVDPVNPDLNTDFAWFGFSLFDSRSDYTDDYAAQDFAMENGQFIYVIGSKHLLTEKVEIGRRLKVNVDILPYVKTCLEEAHEKNFMMKTDFERTRFEGMNIGWEVTGPFNCGITVHRIVIMPVESKKNKTNISAPAP